MNKNQKQSPQNNKNQKQNQNVKSNNKSNFISNNNNNKTREQKLLELEKREIALLEAELAKHLEQNKIERAQFDKMIQSMKDQYKMYLPSPTKKAISDKNATKKIVKDQFGKMLGTTEYENWPQPIGISTDLAKIIYMIVDPTRSEPLRTPYNAKRCGITKENSTPLTSFNLIDGKARLIVSPGAGKDKIYVSTPDNVDVLPSDSGNGMSGRWLVQNSQEAFQGSLDYQEFPNGKRHYSAYDPDLGYAPISFSDNVEYDGSQKLEIKASHAPLAHTSFGIRVIYTAGGSATFLWNSTNHSITLDSAGVGTITGPIKGVTFVRTVTDNDLFAAGNQDVEFSISVPVLGGVTAFQIPGHISHYRGYDLNNIALFKASGTAIEYRVTSYSALITNDSAALYNGGLCAAHVLDTVVQVAPGVSYEQFVTSGDGHYNSTGPLKKGRYNYSVPSKKMLEWGNSYDRTTPWSGTDWNMVYLLDYSVVASGEIPTKLQAHYVQTATIEIAGPGTLVATESTLDDPKYPTALTALRDAYMCYENPTHESKLASVWQHVTNSVSGFYKTYIDGPIADSVADAVRKEGPKVIAAVGRVAATQLVRTLEMFE